MLSDDRGDPVGSVDVCRDRLPVPLRQFGGLTEEYAREQRRARHGLWMIAAAWAWIIRRYRQRWMQRMMRIRLEVASDGMMA